MTLSISESPFGGRVIQTREFSGLHLADGVYPAHTRVPSHSHQKAVFCIALQGACTEVYSGKTRQYNELTVEFLPPHQTHSLHFPAADTRAFSLDIASGWLERGREYSLRLNNSVHCQGGLLTGLMLKLYAEFRQMDHAAQLAMEGLALEMLVEVSRRRIADSGSTPPRWLVQAAELLDEKFSEQLTITQVAAAAGVHPVHLAREFRRFHGCTIGEYIRRQRIKRACQQLQNSSDSLATIACGAGFADQSHFTRTFKRLIGMTPSQYRATVARASRP